MRERALARPNKCSNGHAIEQVFECQRHAEKKLTRCALVCFVVHVASATTERKERTNMELMAIPLIIPMLVGLVMVGLGHDLTDPRFMNEEEDK